MYPNHSPFPELSCLLSTLGTSPTKEVKDKSNFKKEKREREKKESPRSVCYLYTLWSVVEFLVAFPLSRTESFLSHTELFLSNLGSVIPHCVDT